MIARVYFIGRFRAIISDYSEPLNFLALNYGVLFRKLLLLLSEVVERTLVGFSVAMLRAENIVTLAWVFHESNLLVAFPALVSIGLK
jgi:hypothetical protein